jgi:hypothetical protein
MAIKSMGTASTRRQNPSITLEFHGRVLMLREKMKLDLFSINRHLVWSFLPSSNKNSKQSYFTCRLLLQL